MDIDKRHLVVITCAFLIISFLTYMSVLEQNVTPVFTESGSNQSSSGVQYYMQPYPQPKSYQQPTQSAPSAPNGDSNSSTVNQKSGHSVNTSDDSKQVTKHKITLRWKGRLGNILFQYASLYGIARRNNMTPVIPKALTLLKIFDSLNATVGSLPESQTELCVYAGPPFYKPATENIQSLNKDVTMDSYFQSWRYFHHVKNELAQQFRFAPKYRAKVVEFLHISLKDLTAAGKWKKPSTDPVFIGVHVRRGDFLRNRNHYPVSSKAYINKAIALMEQRHSGIIFVVCSDDKKWVQANVKSSKSAVIYSPFKDGQTDMCLLSHCNHTIMTSGSFSWWGAWLAGGEAVYDTSYPSKKEQKVSNLTEYYFPEWTGLTA